MKVVIFEKRETYVREHTLKLKKSYMSTPSIKDKRFEEIKNKIDGKTPTNILESELKKFAEELNVQIYKGETIEKLEDVYKRVDPNNILALLGNSYCLIHILNKLYCIQVVMVAGVLLGLK